MVNFVVQFAISFGLSLLTRQVPKGPRLSDLAGFRADYGGAVARIYGPENRYSDGTIIWSTEIRERQKKHKKSVLGLFSITTAIEYVYDVDFAVLLSGNPITRVNRIWMNKKLVFDAAGSDASTFTKDDGTHKDFDTLRVYKGTGSQAPDPTIEADKGVGNVPAYLFSSYIVIDSLQLTNFGRSLPYEIEVEVVEAETCTLKRLVGEIVSASGVDTNGISTSGLEGEVRGLVLANQQSVADALRDLSDAFDFDAGDVGGGLRFVPRGRFPRSTFTAEEMGGHSSDDERPEPIRFTHEKEIGLPKEVSVTFSDPDRDYQPNVATSRRAGGNSNANIHLATKLVMSADDAQDMADRIMWQSWSQRDTVFLLADDGREDVGAMEVHAINTPTGYDSFRVLRRTRGANGVIELEMVADRPQLHDSPLPGISAPTPAVSVVLPNPINDPIFIEPPPSITQDATVQLWIAVSGGSGVFASGASTYIVDPAWPGVTVYAATADVEADYRLVGSVSGPAYMGVLTKPLDLTSGATPDVVGVLGVDLTMSGGTLTSASATDAAGGFANLAWVRTAGNTGEFLTFRDQVSTHPYVYDATTLYRGLHGSVEAAHAEGEDFVMIDDALLQVQLPPDMIGVPLFFKFVQPTQSVADVTAYPYTPSGAGFGTGAGGVPSAPEAVTTSTGTGGGVVVSWEANAPVDNVTSYEVYRADGSGADFEDAALLGSAGNSTVYQDLTAENGEDYTYFVVATNVVGGSEAASSEGTGTTGLAQLESFGFTLIAEGTAISVGDKLTYRWPYNFEIAEAQFHVATAQTSGAALTFDIELSGANICAPQAVIANGEESTLDAGGTEPGFLYGAIAKNQEVTFTVVQIGDGTAKGLKATIVGRQT